MSKENAVKKFVTTMIKNFVEHEKISDFTSTSQPISHRLTKNLADNVSDYHNRKNTKNNKGGREL